MNFAFAQSEEQAQAYRQGYQAGIDEAVEIMEDNKIVEQDGHPFCMKEKECEWNEALNDTIKALQDNKYDYTNL